MQKLSSTKTTCSSIAKRFKSVFGEVEVDKIARDCRLMQRKRDITPLALVCACVATFASGNSRWLADIVRALNDLTGKTIRYKPFHNRISKPAFSEFSRQMLNSALQKLTIPVLKSIPGGKLKRFRDIFLHDGTSFAVKNALSGDLPGRFTKISPAAVELHVTMSLLENCAISVTMAPDKESERQYAPSPMDVSGALLLEDRGYEKKSTFREIDAAGGHFIVRGNLKIKPLVVEAQTAQGKRLKHLEGKCFDIKKLPRNNITLDIEWGDQASLYRGRLVVLYRKGRRNKKQFVLLHTNLTNEDFSIEEIGNIYRLRWQIELLFKEWKSHANLSRFDTAKLPIAEGMIWMSLLLATVSRYLATAAELNSEVEISTQRVANSMKYFLTSILRCFIDTKKRFKQALLSAIVFLKENAQRAHPKRDRKSGRLSSGLESIVGAH
jgi:hypothetical protein